MSGIPLTPAPLPQGERGISLRGYKTAIVALLIALAGLADLLPGVEPVISPSAYRWLMLASGVAVLLVRHVTAGPPAWRKSGCCGSSQAGTPAPQDDDDVSYGGTA